MNIGAYIHIPFCRSRCIYCDFNTYAGLGHLIEPYVGALEWQIGHSVALCFPRAAVVRSIYFGGGTPSLLTPGQVERLLTAVRGSFLVSPDSEISLEANPGTVDLTSLCQIRGIGVNRLSLGVQYLDDVCLGAIGRIHTAEQARQAVHLARQAGFDNLSLDLIYGLPGQDLAGWRRTLAEAVDLRPEHLSLYALTLDASREVSVPDDDVAAEMYEAAEDMLSRAGYGHYEISNWSLPGRECAHNLIYWRNEPYLGFGAGAHSSLPLDAVREGWLLQARLPGDRWTRFSSVRRPDDFIAACQRGQSAVADLETLGVSSIMAQTMFLGLRLLEEGVAFDSFASRFGRDLRSVYKPQLRELEASGLIIVNATRMCLTKRGHLLGNEVFQRFLE
jgi:oxygen-independent coproporphyrinogen-3 oxidase